MLNTAARPVPARTARPDAGVFVTVVVPVRNEAKHVRTILDWLVGQNYDPARFEVVVADGRSEDGTPDIVREYQDRHPNVRLFDNPRRWASAGRNIGVKQARGEVVLVVDGHCDVGDPDYLAKLESAFGRSGADSLARPQPLDVADASPFQRAVAMARRSFAGHNPASHIYSEREGFINPQSSAVAYRRHVFDAVGLFDEDFDACEDVEFNHRVHRAGLTCYFTPSIQIKYYPRRSARALFYQMSRYGVGRVRLTVKHPGSLSAACLGPACFLLWLPLGLLAGLAWPAALWLWAASLAAYAAFVGLGTLAAVARTRPADWPAAVRLPWVFAVIHAGFGSGVLAECRRRVAGWFRIPRG